MKTISVIVPVYNVQDYLEECIESIIKQSYRDLEIILIDDGSIDQSGLICDAYGEKDKRIKVIHQKNGGSANAKNTGLKVATGEYLSFVDSDDYLEPDAYKLMVENLEKDEADVIQCCFNEVYTEVVEERKRVKKTLNYNTESFLELFTLDWTCGLLWNKLYKRNIFKNIFFEEGHKIDDEFFTYQGIMNATKILYIPMIVYNYRKRASSVMMSDDSQEKILMDKLEYLSIRRKKIGERYPSLQQCFDEHYLNMILILSRNSYSTKNSMLYIKHLIKEYFLEKKKTNMSLEIRCKLWIIQCSSINRLLNKREKKPDNITINNCFS